ncbi:glycosyltransferase family protein [Anaerosoma tenue]|uniref:glycosyltransferase family protein n=1 Tax=Anaerosoma tenue TaxID=2933588 RepID=UPI002260EF75|nr:hypothetical protein [Anaerosoma tenue]MCK8114077.1 hypothetical protein [Anaerosoma tenue]
MRVLALSNERRPGADPDIPWALGALQARAVVSEYHVYSTPVRVAELGAERATHELVDVISRLRPDVVAFFHSGSCLFTSREVDHLREACPDALWIYREGDPFTRWTAPYPRRALPVATRCEAAYIFSGGYLAQTLRRAGVPFVTYTPSWVNPERFPFVWSPDGPHVYDVVFVGNNTKAHLRPFPGARERAKLVNALQRRFGDTLAIYGKGWTGQGVKGTCSLDEIPLLYRQSRVAVGIDHSVGPYQFSNRLPIALSSGIPLAHNSFEGAREILAGLSPRQFFTDTRQALSVVERLVDAPSSELGTISSRQRKLAVRAFACDKVLGFMLETASGIRDGNDPALMKNPWLAERGSLGIGPTR